MRGQPHLAIAGRRFTERMTDELRRAG
jgi:hypothetical protein